MRARRTTAMRSAHARVSQFRDRPPTLLCKNCKEPNFPTSDRKEEEQPATRKRIPGQASGPGRGSTNRLGGQTEEWPSGLRHRLGKAAGPQGSRGFESRFLRHPVDADFRSAANALRFRAQRFSPIDDPVHEDRCHYPTDDGCYACGAWARPTTCGCGVIGSRAGLRYQ